MTLYIREAIVGTVESRFYDMTRRQQNHVGNVVNDCLATKQLKLSLSRDMFNN